MPFFALFLLGKVLKTSCHFDKLAADSAFCHNLTPNIAHASKDAGWCLHAGCKRFRVQRFKMDLEEFF